MNNPKPEKPTPQKRYHHTVDRQLDMLITLGMEGEPDLGFMARMLVQATLPHSDPGDVREFERVNGNFHLYLQPGPKMGLPYGSYPRLILAWLTTEAVRTRSRHVVLGASLSQFMQQLDIIPTGGRWGSITRLRDQMKRLFSARIAGAYDNGDEGTWQYKTMEIADEVNLWWSPQHPEQATIWESTIHLGEKFFAEIIRHPVPLDMQILKALKRSPLGLDLYVWLTYRVSYLQEPVYISWEQLHAQFGADYTGEKGIYNFSNKAKRELAKIRAAWPNLNYETPRGRLKLSPSRPSIPAAAGVPGTKATTR